MKKERKIKNLLKFTIIAFAPILYVMLHLLPMFFFSASIMREEVNIADVIGMPLFALGLVVYFVFISIKCFDKYIISAKLINRLAIIAIGWFFLQLPVVFVLSNALGGVSMAVVEGGAGSYMSRLPQYLIMSLAGAFFSSIIFFPWIIIANFIINKFFSGMFVTQEH